MLPDYETPASGLIDDNERKRHGSNLTNRPMPAHENARPRWNANRAKNGVTKMDCITNLPINGMENVRLVIPPAIEKTKSLAWDELVSVEPRLLSIVAEARRCRRWPERDRWRMYGRLKADSRELVGWHAGDNRLRNDRSYDLFIDKIVEALGI